MESLEGEFTGCMARLVRVLRAFERGVLGIDEFGLQGMARWRQIGVVFVMSWSESAMTKRWLMMGLALMGFLAAGCAGPGDRERGAAVNPEKLQQQRRRAKTMNPVNYFEIPVADMARAVRFYESVLLVDFEIAEIDGHPMALFPYVKDGAGVSGALAHGESYRPGRQGVRIYFAVDDIDATLGRAVEAGGRVLYSKTSIGEHGWVAEFEDSEGNCIAIRSMRP